MDRSAAAGLPLELSSFVGRQREIEQIAPLIVANRLVTLAGPGGAGKTRLAFEIAVRLAPEFADGVVVVELAPLGDASHLVHAVAQALGLSDPTGQITVERIAGHLEQRELLLVLDNCEHLITACAAFAQNLLRRCCLDLRVIATSREPLGVTGELVWRLPPLSLPSSADEIGVSDAVRLFVERAAAAMPGFALTPENSDTVAEICRRLDGMPLAIELAAAQVRILTPQQIVSRLGSALDLLAGGRGTVPRHRTVRAAIDWSYRLLDEPVAAALRRFSVFRGGWDLEAAFEVNDLSISDTLPILAQLIDKSLILAEPNSGAMRYRMRDTIRQYAEERLEESGEAEAVRNWHLTRNVCVAESATRALRSPRVLDKLHALDRDQDNLRAALTYALSKAEESPPHAEQALRLANGLEMYWRIRSTFTEGREWLTRALAARPNRQTNALRAAGLMNAGLLALLQTGPGSASPLLEESLVIWESLEPPDKRGLASCLWRLGMAQYFGLTEARETLSRALALFEEMRDPLGVADARWVLGMTWVGDDTKAARALLEESVALYEQAGDAFMANRPRAHLAELSESSGDHERARRLHQQSLMVARRLGHGLGESFALSRLGWTSLRLGEADVAVAYLSQALELNRQFGIPSGSEILGMGYGRLALNKAEDGLPLFCEAIDTFRQAGDDGGVAAALVGFAHARILFAQHEAAAQLLGAAEAVRERAGRETHWSDRPDYDRCVETVRRELTRKALEAAWGEGKRMSVEEAVAFGMREPDESAKRPMPAHALRTPLQAAKAQYGGLTAREREVAACVARGISNREIADGLVLSERTIEAHIGNILGKLELSSRTQIATWALEKGLAARGATAKRGP